MEEQGWNVPFREYFDELEKQPLLASIAEI